MDVPESDAGRKPGLYFIGLLTADQEEQIQREREAAPEAKLLDDDGFDAYKRLMPGAFMMIPASERAKLFSTAKWRLVNRIGERDSTGMTFGGKSVDQIVAGR